MALMSERVGELPAEVRIVNATTGGAKGSKDARFDLLPWEALAEIAKIYGFGAKKYDEHNWRKGYDWGLSYAALQRHLAAFWSGEDLDPESGLPHMAHAGWHCLTLLTFAVEHPELDNRFKKPLAQINVGYEPSKIDMTNFLP